MTSITKYHYTECGLDNIWLNNGFERHEDTGYGAGTSITDVEGLHVAIGLGLINSKNKLRGAELRFIRHELDLSQGALAIVLGTSEQNLRRWEKNNSISGPAQNLLSVLYNEYVSGTSEIRESLDRLASLDVRLHDEMDMALTADHEWKLCAA